jgi:drug/metabolite transporter (DMT)-like permease
LGCSHKTWSKMMLDAVFGYLLAGSALVLFAGGTLVTKAAAQRIDLALGFLIATTINVIFAALVLGVQLALRAEPLEWNAQALWLFVIAGGFSTYLGRWFFYESVVRFGPARASVFQVSSPLFTALVAWLVLGESLTLQSFAAVALTIAGLILVSTTPNHSMANADEAPPQIEPAQSAVAASPLTSIKRHALGSVLAMGLASSLAYAIGNVLRGAAIRTWHEPVLGALLGALAGLGLHLIFSRDKAALAARLRSADRRGVLIFALMGVTTITAQMCTIASMRYIPVAIAALVTLCSPLLVFPLSYWLLKNSDAVTGRTVLGCALALLGIVMIVLR